MINRRTSCEYVWNSDASGPCVLRPIKPDCYDSPASDKLACGPTSTNWTGIIDANGKLDHGQCIKSKKCDGVPSTDAGCCSSKYPCDLGGGDCDKDSDCKGNLRCGYNNCLIDFSSSESNWNGDADCCISMKIFSKIN